MNLICDSRAVSEVFEKLGISYEVIRSVKIKGYRFVHNQNGSFYAEEQADAEEEALLVKLTLEDMWELNKLQSSIGISLPKADISGESIALSENAENLIYLKRTDASMPESYADLDSIQKYRDRKLQMDTCDIYLLMPGKIEKNEGIWESYQENSRDVFRIFKENIDYCVEEEYNSKFAKSLSRKCLGDVKIEIKDLIDKDTYIQDAVIGLVCHDSGFCVLEIIVQNCSIGGNKLLNYYCANMFTFIFEGRRLSPDQLFEQLHIKKYGKKRSMMFAYGDATEEEMINTLANEEFPMGKIGGTMEAKIKHENIAQYDTAEVYVSSETMLEKCKNIEIFPDIRLAYHAIEIFFVELLLFQDAAIDKIYVELQDEEERQKDYYSIEEATERYEKLSFDMSQAIQFADYEQFNFPTVRESAKRVAKSFELDYVYEKYKVNKEILEAMLRANKRRMQEKQDSIKNQFLLLLSALATVGTLGEIIYAFYGDPAGAVWSYGLAGVIVIAGFMLYKAAMFTFRLAIRHLKERTIK